MNARRTLLTIAIVAMTATSWTTTANALEDGCEAAGGSTCSYRATKAGGIVATGNSWKVSIVRGGVKTSYGPSSWLDAEHSTFKRVNVIRKGDKVFVRSANLWTEWPPVVAGAVAVGSAYNR